MAPEKQPLPLSIRRAGPFEAWQDGLTLANALDRFVNGEAWSRCNSRVMHRFDQLRTDPRSPLSERVEATVRLQDLARACEEQARLLGELRARLIHQLRAGDLLAVGFTVDPASSSKLAVVPREDWANALGIDWECSGLHGHERIFVDVRVLASPTRQIETNRERGSRLTES